MRIPYQYVVLRCVPRVDREEFINVGVVLYSQATDFLDASYRVDHERLHALDPAIDIEEVEQVLDTVCRVCRGEDGQGRPTLETLGRRFGWLSAPRSTVVQPGPVHGGVCVDPAAELAELRARLVDPLPG